MEGVGEYASNLIIVFPQGTAVEQLSLASMDEANVVRRVESTTENEVDLLQLIES